MSRNHIIGSISCGKEQVLLYLDSTLYGIGKKTDNVAEKFPLIMKLSTVRRKDSKRKIENPGQRVRVWMEALRCLRL